MKKLITRKTVIIAAIAVIIALVTLISVNVFNTGGPVTGIANAVSRPLKSWASAIARTFESIYGSIYKYDDIVVKYELTLKELAQLRETAREASELEDEVVRLRRLLGFSERNAGQIYESAQIISPSASNWSSSYSINIGSANSAVSPGDCVITEYGVLIGKITDVGAITSTFISVLDTTFAAGVIIGENGGFATARGDFDLMNQGLLKLDHISGEQPVLPGDSIVTSGSSGVFPAGLVVGEIVEVFNHSTGVGQYATVAPTVPLEMILHVYVITEFNMRGNSLNH